MTQLSLNTPLFLVSYQILCASVSLWLYFLKMMRPCETGKRFRVRIKYGAIVEAFIWLDPRSREKSSEPTGHWRSGMRTTKSLTIIILMPSAGGAESGRFLPGPQNVERGAAERQTERARRRQPRGEVEPE